MTISSSQKTESPIPLANFYVRRTRYCGSDDNYDISQERIGLKRLEKIRKRANFTVKPQNRIENTGNMIFQIQIFSPLGNQGSYENLNIVAFKHQLFSRKIILKKHRKHFCLWSATSKTNYLGIGYQMQRPVANS